MPKKPKGFVAYSARPSSLAETIETAIEKINKSDVIDLKGWKSLKIEGRLIITPILEAIRETDIFICDLTNLNHNVLFELGYAIAHKKRIWILLNSSIENSEKIFKKFKLLTTVGYVSYNNSNDIVKVFYEKQPYLDLKNTIYKDIIEDVIKNRDEEKLLYLKSKTETEASIKLSRRINRSLIPDIVDDPIEVPSQTLTWYAQKVYNSYAVISHFLSIKHKDSSVHNAKTAFVSGLALGFGKDVLMLAHSPYNSPIDYKEVLKKHKTATQCIKMVDGWLSKLENDYINYKMSSNTYEAKIKDRTKLQKISIGEYIAENESENILNYFIETAEYKEALESQRSIFIGRKGSGKTANLYHLSEELKADKRNIVCVIKPVAYELDGVLRMLKQPIHKSEKGFLTESFWKYLIYTELARNAFELLNSKPKHYQFSDKERDFLDFVKQNDSLILPEFSIRLEKVVEKLQNLHEQDSSSSQRIKISEKLHSEIIPKVRKFLGELLEEKKKVVILIDNLDKAWTSETDLPTFSNLLLGLFEVSQRIIRDFGKSDHWRQPVNLSLIIFLRRDIFNQIIDYAPEKDKISFKKITWNDSKLLLRVLEERIIHSSQDTTLSEPSDIWNKYFCDYVNGKETRNYIINCVLPRPRDLIYFAKDAFSKAVNRGHTIVEEKDIIDAEKEYSQHALESIIVEAGDRINNFENLIYEFLGFSEIVTKEGILGIMGTCKIKKAQLHEVIDLLCELCFLGIEVNTNSFKYLYNDKQKQKYKILARKTRERRGSDNERYKINKPFHAYLEININK